MVHPILLSYTKKNFESRIANGGLSKILAKGKSYEINEWRNRAELFSLFSLRYLANSTLFFNAHRGCGVESGLYFLTTFFLKDSAPTIQTTFIHKITTKSYRVT